MTVIWFLLAICALWRNEGGGFVLFGVLAFLCRPTGILLLGLVGVAAVMTQRERRWAWLRWAAIAVATCAVVLVLYDRVFVASVASVPSASIPGARLLERYRFLRLDDFARFAWAAFPAGVLPFLSLLAFQWQDASARFIAIIALAYFAAFYFPAFTALHHFIPAMVLPMVVFWRLWITKDFRTDVLRRLPSPLAIVFFVRYATQPERADVPAIYVVQPSGVAPPPGFAQAVGNGAFSVYVRDLELWRRDRETPPPADFRSRLYDIPLSTLVAFRGIREGNYTIDVPRSILSVVRYIRGAL